MRKVSYSQYTMWANCPMAWKLKYVDGHKFDDKDVCLKIIRLLLTEMGPTTPVNSYNKRTENTFKKILDF